jgi:hypothetical protein
LYSWNSLIGIVLLEARDREVDLHLDVAADDPRERAVGDHHVADLRGRGELFVGRLAERDLDALLDQIDGARIFVGQQRRGVLVDCPSPDAVAFRGDEALFFQASRQHEAQDDEEG